MADYTVLLVEDERDLLEFTRAALTRAGYRVCAADTLSRAQERLAADAPDLIVLDVMLPDGSGIDLCRLIRRATNAPILFLTSMGESEHIVSGLRAGGDDYVVKPFQLDELLARIEALLRRVERSRQQPGSFRRYGVTIDPAVQRAYMDGSDLLLKPKEFMLLAALVRAQDEYRTAAALYAEVWGMDSNEDARTVLVHLSNLRAKLRQTAGRQTAEIRRYGDEGYRLEAVSK